MIKPDLKVVPKTTQPYSNEAGRQRMAKLRRILLTAAARYVRDGDNDDTDHNAGDRLRTASDLSGIPRYQIEAELKK
jgi:hypothetical protein